MENHQEVTFGDVFGLLHAWHKRSNEESIRFASPDGFFILQPSDEQEERDVYSSPDLGISPRVLNRVRTVPGIGGVMRSPS